MTTFNGPFIFTQWNGQKHTVNSYYEKNETYCCKINNPAGIGEVNFDISVNDIQHIDPDFENKKGKQFNKWSEVKEMVKKERLLIEREQKKAGGVYKFHYHGMILLIDGERVGDAEERITLSALKDMVKDAEINYPNSKIEISLEGHYDWWESYAALFGGEEYMPSDDYLDIVLYTNN